MEVHDFVEKNKKLVQILSGINWWEVKFWGQTVNRVADDLSEYPTVTMFCSYVLPFI